MKLFVNGRNGKIYLNVEFPNRRALAAHIGSRRFELGGQIFSVEQVQAESVGSDSTAGLILGGLFGLLGGPAGVLFGATIGGVIGNNSDNEDEQKINEFNRSII